MGKPSAPAKRPNEFKYGMPLYGAVWPPGDHYFVCGGGGHGLIPRIVWAQYAQGKCTDQRGEYKLGPQTPMRMALAPSGTTLLLGNSDGGVRRFQIDLAHLTPRLIEVTGLRRPQSRPEVLGASTPSSAFSERFSALDDEVKAMSFDRNGHRLALGFATGVVKVLDYPSMRVQLEWRLEDGVKDLDLQYLQGDPSQGEQACPLMLATVCEGGVCQVWDVTQARPQLACTLAAPSGMDKARFTRCRWSRLASLPYLYVVVQRGRDASYCAAYGLVAPGDPRGSWALMGAGKLEDGPNAALEISRNGLWLAAGQTSGRLLVVDTSNLQVRKQEEKASMVFVTAVTFSSDDRAVMAVGGDASCFVMDTPQAPAGGGGRGRGWWLLLLLLVVVLAAAAWLVLSETPEEQLREWLDKAVQHIQQLLGTESGPKARGPLLGGAPGGVGAGPRAAWQQQQRQQQQQQRRQQQQAAAAWTDGEL